MTVMTYAEMVEIKPDIFCKVKQSCMPADNRIYLQIYLQQPCIPGDNRGLLAGMGLVDPRM